VVFDFCSAGAETSSQAAPDSVLADILPHPLSLAKSLFPRASLDRLPWHSIAPDAGELLTQTVIEGVAVAICISMSGRPTRCEAELVGTRGSLFVDFFHGYSVFHRGHVSKTRKILNPYIHSVQTLVGASGNLLRRAVRRESAYPGLASLFDAFYRSLSDGQRLVSDEVVLEIAEARERLVDSYD
jgi:predicted dehydrogenase